MNAAQQPSGPTAGAVSLGHRGAASPRSAATVGAPAAPGWTDLLLGDDDLEARFDDMRWETKPFRFVATAAGTPR